MTHRAIWRMMVLNMTCSEWQRLQLPQLSLIQAAGWAWPRANGIGHDRTEQNLNLEIGWGPDSNMGFGIVYNFNTLEQQKHRYNTTVTP